MNNATSEPLIRVMALHALTYCPRLFYLEEVEEIRVADDRVFAGRELHASAEEAEGGQWEAVNLSCPTIGLVGRIDCLRRRDGAYIPYEHKRGRCFRDADATPQAWRSDLVQVAAYAMMIEEAIGQDVPEGRVHYHADNVTVRIPIDEAVRRQVRQAIDEARRLRQSLDRPAVAENEHLCIRCSLAPVCLPEETRRLNDPRHATIRLFPAEDDRTVLHVMSPGATVGRSGQMLVVRPRDGENSNHPVREVRSVILHGFAQITTQALRLCANENITVHWLAAGGNYIAGLVAGPSQVQRRLRQYAALSDESCCLSLARALVLAKTQSQLRYLLRASRANATIRQKIEPALRRVRDAIRIAAICDNRDSLRGHEGEAAVAYLGSLNDLLTEKVPDELHYGGRTRRPPMDRFNAILSFGYALLYSAVMRSVMAVGLEPAFGFFHTPRSAAHPLVLDLIELFRVILWDMVVVGSLNRGQWDPEADFQVSKARIWLSDAGRKKAIGLFETRLQESWKHPVVNYSLSYARTIELEVRLLEKEWTGEPGLFARMRLR